MKTEHESKLAALTEGLRFFKEWGFPENRNSARLWEETKQRGLVGDPSQHIVPRVDDSEVEFSITLVFQNGDQIHPSTRIEWEVAVSNIYGDAVEGTFRIVWESTTGNARNAWTISDVDYCR